MLGMQSRPNSWFTPLDVNGKSYDFLIDSGASKSVITRHIYDTLPDPNPLLQKNKMEFEVANGDICPAIRVCHLLITLMFGNVKRSLSMPVFVCDHLSSTIECIFGIDAEINILDTF